MHACKEAEMVEQTYDRSRKECGGLKLDQARRLKELDQENAQLKRLFSELSLEKLVLKDIASEPSKPLTTTLCGDPSASWAWDEQATGVPCGKDRVWRGEGLKVTQRQKPGWRPWLNDGSCVRLCPEQTNHVWSYDFVSAKTHDGRTVGMLNLIDEHTGESLLVRLECRWSSAKVIEAPADTGAKTL